MNFNVNLTKQVSTCGDVQMLCIRIRRAFERMRLTRTRLTLRGERHVQSRSVTPRSICANDDNDDNDGILRFTG